MSKITKILFLFLIVNIVCLSSIISCKNEKDNTTDNVMKILDQIQSNVINVDFFNDRFYVLAEEKIFIFDQDENLISSFDTSGEFNYLKIDGNNLYLYERKSNSLIVYDYKKTINEKKLYASGKKITFENLIQNPINITINPENKNLLLITYINEITEESHDGDDSELAHTHSMPPENILYNLSTGDEKIIVDDEGNSVVCADFFNKNSIAILKNNYIDNNILYKYDFDKDKYEIIGQLKYDAFIAKIHLNKNDNSIYYMDNGILYSFNIKLNEIKKIASLEEYIPSELKMYTFNDIFINKGNIYISHYMSRQIIRTPVTGEFNTTLNNNGDIDQNIVLNLLLSDTMGMDFDIANEYAEKIFGGSINIKYYAHSEYSDRIGMKLLAGDSDFDIFYAPDSSAQYYVNHKLYSDLSQNSIITKNFNKMFDGIKELYTHNKDIWGIPISISMPGFSVNDELLEKIQIDLKTEKIDWSEFYNLSIDLKEKAERMGIDDFYILDTMGQNITYIREYMSNYVDYQNKKISPDTVSYESFFEIYQKMIDEGLIFQGYNQTGNSLFRLDSGTFDLYNRTNLYTPPLLNKNDKYYTNMYSLIINPKSENIEAAMKYFEIFTSEEVQKYCGSAFLYKDIDIYSYPDNFKYDIAANRNVNGYDVLSFMYKNSIINYHDSELNKVLGNLYIDYGNDKKGYIQELYKRIKMYIEE